MVTRMNTLSIALDLELILVAELEKVFLAFLEAEGRRNLVIHVQLDCLKDNVALVVDNIAKAINKVASAIDQALALVKQLTPIATHDNKVAHVVDLEVSHNVS